MNIVKIILDKKGIYACLFFMFSCQSTDVQPPQGSDQNTPNFLFIIADDLGKDAIKGYQEGVVKPTTPHIDSIRQNGITFNNFWSNPTCTPTRSAILTGKYGYHTNVKGVGDELSLSELSLQQYIHQNSAVKYNTGIIGKWHLSGNNINFNPEIFGIDYYVGLIRGAVDDYYRWQLSEDGSSVLKQGYITEEFTNLAKVWIEEQDTPWFLWLAYTAPHTPFHTPPQNMHSQGNLEAYSENTPPLPYYLAAIEALDYQIGELLDHPSTEQKEKTLIVIIGDNGTPNTVAQWPYVGAKVKGTLYQGGINVPMYVAGHGVTRKGESDDNLICATDLFATIAAATGVDVSVYEDSHSFFPLLSKDIKIREFQYSEVKVANNDIWTIRDDQFKLFQSDAGNIEFYDVRNDPYEVVNLLNSSLTNEQMIALEKLEKEALSIRK